MREDYNKVGSESLFADCEMSALTTLECTVMRSYSDIQCCWLSMRWLELARLQRRIPVQSFHSMSLPGHQEPDLSSAQLYTNMVQSKYY